MAFVSDRFRQIPVGADIAMAAVNRFINTNDEQIPLVLFNILIAQLVEPKLVAAHQSLLCRAKNRLALTGFNFRLILDFLHNLPADQR